TSASGPTDATVCLGQDMKFATAANGVGPFDYQWLLDGNAAGTNGPSLTVPTASLSSGDHTVEVTVTGRCGLAVTNSATLRVQGAFAANGPAAATVCPGTDASFVTEPSGTAPFGYQWSLDGVAVGTNGPAMTVPTAGLALGDHTVQVVVSGQCAGAPGTVTNMAKLTVTDTTAPSLSCPAVPGASADANCQAAVPDVLGGVTVSDDCSAAGSDTLRQSTECGTLG